jgi:type IV pilus assembly protein PilQ
LIGTLEQVQLATDYLTKLDVRRKQVAINVKIVEVDLTNNRNVGASFSFGIADNFFSVNQGAASANFGSANPSLIDPNSLTSPPTIFNPFTRDPSGNVVQPSLNINQPILDSNGNTLGFGSVSPATSDPLAPVVTGLTPGSIVTSGASGVTSVINQTLTYGLSQLFQFPLQFLLRLQAQVTKGDAKILTDPTLIVQEGNQSQINLTSQVFSGFTEQRVVEGNVATTRILPQPPIDVGIIMNVQVDQIDDNNFITMSVSPEVSSPGQQIIDPSRNNLLIQQLVNRRRLETGKVRLRDGQTLILAGIIQEIDRTITTKTPILGDIPILRLLFRSRREQRDRNEIVILITPRILDDSARSPYGFEYLPGSEVQKVLQQLDRQQQQQQKQQQQQQNNPNQASPANPNLRR